MKKKLRRLLQPSMTLFFVVMVCFGAATLLQGQYVLGAAELAVTMAMFAGYRYSCLRRRRALTEYVQSASPVLDSAQNGDIPFPAALVQLHTGEIAWSNKPFASLVQLGDKLDPPTLFELMPDLKLDWLRLGKREAPEELRYLSRRFRVTGNLMLDNDARSGVMLGMLYFQDLTDLLQVRDEYIRSRPMIAIVLVDNYDELTNNLPDAAISTLNAEINTKISEWADNYSALLRKLERNRYMLLMEARELARMAEQKFELLEVMRTVTGPNGVPATVSIGIGKDGVDFRENYNFAALSIEMALSRGGDQAVVKDRYDFTFFGGRNKHSERRTKVKSRVMSASLAKLITQSSRVFIMGHKMADLDALGAAIGVCCLCRKNGVKANIVIDPEMNAAKSLLAKLKPMPEYAGCFITGQEALLEADAKSLLIVVDTNRPDQVECKPLLESIQRVMVIDHHRRAADYIEQPTLNLHEPSASSASELVTELMQYMLEPSDIHAEEAAALLAGIALDTKNFSVRTNAQTFEAAAFLRRLGADPIEVKKLFQNDLPSTVARYQIVQKARLYREKIAIATLEQTVTRTLAAQAADELLNVSGIETSFVLYPQDTQTIISARSIGEANVQLILEPLGGSGNAATAGAQVKNRSVSATLEDLVRSIDKFFEK